MCTSHTHYVWVTFLLSILSSSGASSFSVTCRLHSSSHWCPRCIPPSTLCIPGTHLLEPSFPFLHLHHRPRDQSHHPTCTVPSCLGHLKSILHQNDRRGFLKNLNKWHGSHPLNPLEAVCYPQIKSWSSIQLISLSYLDPDLLHKFNE